MEGVLSDFGPLGLEREAGIEPTSSGWWPEALPLSYSRNKLVGFVTTGSLRPVRTYIYRAQSAPLRLYITTEGYPRYNIVVALKLVVASGIEPASFGYRPKALPLSYTTSSRSCAISVALRAMPSASKEADSSFSATAPANLASSNEPSPDVPHGTSLSKSNLSNVLTCLFVC